MGRKSRIALGESFAALVLVAFAIAAGTLPARAAANAGELRVADTIAPEELARELASKSAPRPVLLQVGFKVLYRTGHIPDSRYVGPGSKPDGLDSLRSVLHGLRPQQPVVLYCGCCPWDDCPNVRPAFRVARAMGFRNVKVLYISKNLQHDWIDKGFQIDEDADSAVHH